MNNNRQSRQIKQHLTDNELLQAIATSADGEAFKTLYNRYCKQLLRYLYQAIGDLDAASDLSQNFWMYVWQHASRMIYEDTDSVEKIFFHIAAKRVADYYRSSRHSRDVSLEESPGVAEKESPHDSPESDCYTEEIRKITEEVLNKYPELDKQIFICQKELNYTAQETAGKHNTNSVYVYKKVSLIMKELRMELEVAGYSN